MRRWMVAGCCLVAMVSVLSSCRSKRDDRPPGKTVASKAEGAGRETPTKKPVLALVMKSLANEFFTTMAEGAKAHQRENQDIYELVVNGIKDERDLAQQVSLVEQMVARKVDAIVIAPADSKALIPVCKRAMESGIVVINIDNKLDDEILREVDVHIPFVGPDNMEGARVVGAFLSQKLQEGDSVAILEGIPTAYNAQQRRLGFETAMKDANINVVSVQSAQWEMEKANTIASAMIREHSGLRAILCSNDSMALGAVAAVKAAGKRGEIHVVGFDNISAVQEMVREGRVLATADQHADQLAVFGIEFALQVLEGSAPPKDKQTPVDLITAETLG